jgi:Arc/MetJ-type ribon-helix-helix transcriptional regulator
MKNFIMNATYHYSDTMASINVKIPKAMEGEIARFLNDHPYYLNKSELVRDAIRHLISEKRRLSKGTLRAIEKGKEQVEKGEGMTLEEVREELEG